MLYKFKESLQDFQVSEVIQEPSGKGDYLYIFFEKSDQNTMDILDFLNNEFKTTRNDRGIAGLKDKSGITKQRLSIHKQKLEQIGGEKKLINSLNQKVNILETTHHNELLTIGKNLGNEFFVRLKAKEKISGKIKDKIKSNIAFIKSNGFPNYYGFQRFGKGFRNIKRAKKIFDQEDLGKLHVKFNLQSFSSFHFNNYIQDRIKNNFINMDGDILLNGYSPYDLSVGIYNQKSNIVKTFDYKKAKQKNQNKILFSPDYFLSEKEFDTKKWFPAGPVLGDNLLVSQANSQNYIYEKKFLEDIKFEKKLCPVFRKYKIRGRRRPIITYPQNLSYRFSNNNDLEINFFLPTGSYATVLLYCILNNVDTDTLVQNNLNIF